MIHLADLSSPAKSFGIAKTWSLRVSKEFSAQNKFEQELEYVPETPYFQNLDDQATLAKSEMNFIKFVVLPFWKSLNKFFDNELTTGVFNLENNMEKWEQMRIKELGK